ncbi:hypothetical protein SK571_42130 [Lentzea sp. BCCO 10_0798]|uniref:Outer membrane channel protein CpnT-like N-terminal domain-containing protein n=1 Tax=Lentzea kristufekii TaxID=3095430 RepID=A0ABU4U622_9PSEU|nr:hypothetical protein [Lentzea sp. BCCO 10_0798]MDX8056017.1 hypothetical protein [Lentzea sp. BCCO 10_0798]
MGIEMPAEVRWLIPIVVGDSWPEGDETALQRLAEVWKQAATDVDDAMRAADDAVRQASSNMDGEAAEAFKKYWEKFVKGEEATLPKMKDVSEKLSTACRNCAMQIEYAKLSIIIALVILAIQIAVMIASAVASFGASTAGIVPAQLATRAGVQIVFRQLVQQLMQQVGRNLIGKLALQVGIEVATSVATDLAVQGIQLAKGTRDTLDTNMTLDAAKSGLISGVVGAGVGAGMGKALGDGVGDSIGRSIGRNAAEEAVIGAGSALAEGALSEEGIQAEDVLFGATSGAVSGSVSGMKSGIEGVNADIAAPTAGDMPSPSAMPRPEAAPRMDGPPPTAPSPSSAPDTEAPPRRSADATNTSYAAPPTEQPQHRATPDATPPSSAPQPSQQPQGFSQSPGQSAPPTAPAASNAPAAPRTAMPTAPPMGGPSPSSGGGFSPSNSGGPQNHSPSPTGSGQTPSQASGSHSPNTAGSNVHSGPSPTSGNAPHGGGPVQAGHQAPNPSSPASAGSAGHNPPGSPAPAGHHTTSPSGPMPTGTSGPTPGSPHHGGPAGAAAGPPTAGHGAPAPNGPLAGPAPAGPTSHAPGPGGPAPLPHQAPQRQHPADGVHQAATSTPAASMPFTAPPQRGTHDAPPVHGSAGPAHVPPPQAAPPQHPHRHAPQAHRSPPQAPPQRAPQQSTHATHPQQPPARPSAVPQTQPAPRHGNGAPHLRPLGESAPPAPTNAPRPESAHQAELARIKRNNTPVEMPDGMRHLEQWAKRTDAGLSLHVGQASPYHSTARNVAPDPNRFTVDIHGNSSRVSIGDTALTPRQLADIIRGAGWDGQQPIRLISCQTGREGGGFAAQLSRELGADVVAPRKDVWVDLQGNVFASSSHLDPHNAALHRPGWPPNGDWVTFSPDGSTRNHSRPTPPDHTPTWGDVPPAEASKAWRRNWPSPGEQPPPGNWQQNRGPRPPYDPRLDRSRQLPPPRPGFAPPPGMSRPPMPTQGGPRPPMPPQGGHRQPMPPQAGPRPPMAPQGGPRPPMPPQGGQQPPMAPQGGPRPPMPQGGPRPPMPPQMRPNPPLRPNGPMAPPGAFGPPGHRPPPPGVVLPQDARRHDEPVRPHQPVPTVANDLPGGPAPERAPEPTPAQEPRQPPFPTKRKSEADLNREAAMRTFTKPEPEATPRPNVVRRPKWTGDLTVEFLDGTLQEQFQRDKANGGKTLYESELTHDFEPGDLPPGLTTEIPKGAYDHMATPVDLDGVYLDATGGQPVHRDKSEGLAFLDEPLFRMDDREFAPLLREGHQPRNTANLGMGAHMGDTIRAEGSAFVSFSASPEATIHRNLTTAGEGLIVRHDPRQVALTGVAITRVQYMHEGYHPYGIDSDASYVNSGRKNEGGHRESEYLFAGGFPADHIYRVWPRIAHFDVDGNVIKIEARPPIINENFRWKREMEARR